MVKLFNKEYILNTGVVPNTAIPKLATISYDQINIDMNDLVSKEFLTEYKNLIVINPTNTALITTGLTDTQDTVIQIMDQIYRWGFALHITPLQHNLNTSIGAANGTNPNYTVGDDNILSKTLSLYKDYYNSNKIKLITFLDKEKISYKVDDITNYEEVKKTSKSFYKV
jgi:hypothetical protein